MRAADLARIAFDMRAVEKCGQRILPGLPSARGRLRLRFMLSNACERKYTPKKEYLRYKNLRLEKGYFEYENLRLEKIYFKYESLRLEKEHFGYEN